MCAIITDLAGNCDCITERILFSRKFPYGLRALEAKKALFVTVMVHSVLTTLKMKKMWTCEMQMLTSKTVY